MKKPATNRPSAYSYVRWSSPQQAAGDSLRRQVERAAAYAETHGLALVEGQKWEDHGKSAYRGKNWHEGALGAFVKAADDGDIPSGSFLLVEALDRISRDNVLPALNRLQEITQRGITIVTLMDGRQWDSDSLKDTANLFYLVGMFSTANIESKNKQDRSLAYWRRKRQEAAESGTAPTRTCPLWLTVGKEGKYQPIPDRVEAIKRIYQLALDGMGSRRIARKLNDMGIPKFTDPARPKAGDKAGWSGNYVHHILTTDATIGVWRGHRLATLEEGNFVRRREADPQNGLVEDGTVYPAVVEKDVWLRVQEKVKGRNGQKRDAGKPVGQAALTMANLFTGLCRCSCGAAVRYHLAGKHARPKLVCSAHLTGSKSSCVIKRWDYKSVEVFLLYALAEGEVLDHAKLFPDVGEDAMEAAVAALEAERDTTRAEVLLATEGADRIVAAIESGTDTPRMRIRLAKLEQQSAENEERLVTLDGEIARERAKPRDTQKRLEDAREALERFIDATWQRSHARGEGFGFEVEKGGYEGKAQQLTDEEVRELRERLHHQLREVVSEVSFKAYRNGAGRLTLRLLPQGEMALKLDNDDRTALPVHPSLVPPMELEDIQLASGKGKGRGRITKALLNVRHGDKPDEVVRYAV